MISLIYKTHYCVIWITIKRRLFPADQGTSGWSDGAPSLRRCDGYSARSTGKLGGAQKKGNPPFRKCAKGWAPRLHFGAMRGGSSECRTAPDAGSGRS